MAKVDRRGLRILVGAASFADAAAALRIVERLPSSLCTGLGGVLVDEMDTLAACQIPDQRFISQSGVTTLAPSLSQLRTMIKSDARAFKLSLAQAAGPSGTDWVFAQDKGELVGTSLRAADGWDILVIGYRQVHKIPGKIINLTRPGASSDEMDVVSRNLSQQFAAARIEFSVDTDANSESGPLSPMGFQFDTFDKSLRALGRTNALAVLVDLTRGPVRNQNDLARLLEAARCPLIIFGASGSHLLLEHSTHIPAATSSGGHSSDG